MFRLTSLIFILIFILCIIDSCALGLAHNMYCILEGSFIFFACITAGKSLPTNYSVDDEQVQKQRTTAVPVQRSSQAGNSVFMILLLTAVVVLLIALCAFCYSCYFGRRKEGIPSRTNVADEPNAPSREQIQAVFDFHRQVLQESERRPQNLSRSSSFHSSLTRWASIPHLPAAPASDGVFLPKSENQRISYATTPIRAAALPELQRKWSESSAQRIERLRTKLVARFPSASTQNSSDISVFFSTSSRPSDRDGYSQLRLEEEKGVDNMGQDDCELTPPSTSQKIPTIVIEFVK